MKVLLVGATGYLGFYFAQELVKGGHDTSALCRPDNNSSDERTKKLDALKSAGVAIVEGSINDETDKLANILKQFTAVVVALPSTTGAQGDLKLIEAVKKAGTIKRYVPSEYSGELDMDGPLADYIHPGFAAMLGSKKIFAALHDAGVPYTKVASHMFMGYLLPGLGMAGPPFGNPPPSEVEVFGTGNTRGAMTAEEDIGVVVSRVLDDPRAADKTVVIKVNTLTQNEVIDTWERLSSKKVTRTLVSLEQLESKLAAAAGDMLAFIRYAIGKALWYKDGPYVWQEIRDPAISATELYPDIKFTTAEEYLRRLS